MKYSIQNSCLIICLGYIIGAGSSDNPDDGDSVGAGVVPEQVSGLGDVVYLQRIRVFEVLGLLGVLLPGPLQGRSQVQTICQAAPQQLLE